MGRQVSGSEHISIWNKNSQKKSHKVTVLHVSLFYILRTLTCLILYSIGLLGCKVTPTTFFSWCLSFCHPSQICSLMFDHRRRASLPLLSGSQNFVSILPSWPNFLLGPAWAWFFFVLSIKLSDDLHRWIRGLRYGTRYMKIRRRILQDWCTDSERTGWAHIPSP